MFCEARPLRHLADRDVEEKARVLAFGVGRLAVEVGEGLLERQGVTMSEAHEVLRSFGE
jgi:hypothetical protein